MTIFLFVALLLTNGLWAIRWSLTLATVDSADRVRAEERRRCIATARRFGARKTAAAIEGEGT